MLAAERGGKLTNGMRNIRRTLTEAISAILVNLQRFKVWSRWVLSAMVLIAPTENASQNGVFSLWVIINAFRRVIFRVTRVLFDPSTGKGLTFQHVGISHLRGNTLEFV